MKLGKAFDYVVVGAGSAGCIVAAELAKDASVLLIEAGDPAGRNPETLSADGFKYAFANDRLMWHRMTSPQAGCGNRRLYAGTGRGMGGSGAVNGMVYTRGDKRDFDNWPIGWKWNDNLPAFEAIEQKLGIQPRPSTPFVDKFIASAQAVGMQHKDHLNDGNLSGFVGCNDINYSGDTRRSSYRSWIYDNRPANLLSATNAKVMRLLFDDDQQCIAVEFRDNKGLHQATVNQEVILCAGALETPKLLMLSGIGPKAELETLGIPVIIDAPGVGKNLQDHPNVCLFYRSAVKVDFEYPQVYAFDQASRSDNEAPSAQADSCFVCYAAAASIKQSTQRMLPVLALPGRLHSIAPLRWLLRGMINLAFALPPLKAWVSQVFGIVVILGKPDSCGEVRLTSANPAMPLQIDPACYRTATDKTKMLAAVRKAIRIAEQSALTQPGIRPLSAAAKTDHETRIWKWITSATMTTFHFCGTCRMGTDELSPADTQLKIKGLQNVRVADASVFPEIPVSAINAPSMMVGYRAAKIIRG